METDNNNNTPELESSLNNVYGRDPALESLKDEFLDTEGKGCIDQSVLDIQERHAVESKLQVAKVELIRLLACSKNRDYTRTRQEQYAREARDCRAKILVLKRELGEITLTESLLAFRDQVAGNITEAASNAIGKIKTPKIKKRTLIPFALVAGLIVGAPKLIELTSPIISTTFNQISKKNNETIEESKSRERVISILGPVAFEKGGYNRNIENVLDWYIKNKYPNHQLDFPEKASVGYRSVDTYKKLEEAMKEVDQKIARWTKEYPKGYKIIEARNKAEVESMLGHAIVFLDERGGGYNNAIEKALDKYIKIKYPNHKLDFPEKASNGYGWTRNYTEFREAMEHINKKIAKWTKEYPEGYKIIEARNKVKVESILGHPVEFSDRWNYVIEGELREYLRVKYPELSQSIPKDGFGNVGWTNCYTDFIKLAEEIAASLPHVQK
jgi:hypothetical protein